MKKTSIIFLALIIVSGVVFHAEASAASVWVSYCIHNGYYIDTMFEILFEGDFAGRKIIWQFNDTNGTHVIDGEIIADCNPDVFCFSWIEESGFGLDNVAGFICFWTEPETEPESGPIGYTEGGELYITGICLNTAADEAFDIYPRLFEPGGPIGTQDITSFSWIDPAVNASTSLIFIAISELSLTTFVGGCPNFAIADMSGRYTVRMYDDVDPEVNPPYFSDGRSVYLEFENGCLNIIDPPTIPGLPSDWLNPVIIGSYEFDHDLAFSVFGFSIIRSDTGVFGAFGVEMRTCGGQP